MRKNKGSVRAARWWELLAETAELLRPARDEFIRQAAQGELLPSDDTSMRVLNLTRPEGDVRTGVFTTGVVALACAQRIALFCVPSMLDNSGVKVPLTT